MYLPSASNLASKVDFVFWFVTLISVFFLVLITVLMIYFAIRYHRSRYTTPKDIEGHLWLELVWTVIPTVLVLMMFWYGWDGFKAMREVPKDALVIQAIGQMWSWNFDYGNGKTSPELYVPQGRPVKMELVSRDVLHSFFIPAFRVKEDVVPGKDNYLWFTATERGTYDIQCAEYCGQRHSYMLSKVHVISELNFADWLSGKGAYAAAAGAAAEAPGLSLLKNKGCVACHTVDGSPLVGPSLKGIFGKTEACLVAGKEEPCVVDEAYIQESLLAPTAKVVKGFPPVMPSQQGLLKDDEIAAIIAYIKELK